MFARRFDERLFLAADGGGAVLRNGVGRHREGQGIFCRDSLESERIEVIALGGGECLIGIPLSVVRRQRLKDARRGMGLFRRAVMQHEPHLGIIVYVFDLGDNPHAVTVDRVLIPDQRGVTGRLLFRIGGEHRDCRKRCREENAKQDR